MLAGVDSQDFATVGEVPSFGTEANQAWFGPTSAIAADSRNC